MGPTAHCLFALLVVLGHPTRTLMQRSSFRRKATSFILMLGAGMEGLQATLLGPIRRAILLPSSAKFIGYCAKPRRRSSIRLPRGWWRKTYFTFQETSSG